MNDLTPVEDLRPAPRTAPPWLLSLMVAAAAAGAGLLVFSGRPEQQVAAADPSTNLAGASVAPGVAASPNGR